MAATTSVEATTITVILCDDHDLLRAGLVAMLDFYDDIQVVGEATNGREAIELYDEKDPDVVVMDISMPVMDGIEASSIICRRHPNAKVLIMTQYEEQQFIEPALEAGVSGFITKRSAGGEFVQALRTVSDGGFYIHPQMARLVANQAGRRQTLRPEDTLTPRERQVLTQIVEGKTNGAIARSLSLSVKTVEWHRSNLMAKLGTHSVAELVRYAIRHDLVDDDE